MSFFPEIRGCVQTVGMLSKRVSRSICLISNLISWEDVCVVADVPN